jgi:sugar O-acyltransferase (sialic acid O-acetyltransferase NeuD family)
LNCPVIILGAGGHAGALIDILKLRSIKILGITDRDSTKTGQSKLGVQVIGGDDVIAKYLPATVQLVNGLGSVRAGDDRKSLFERFKNCGYGFANVIHPSAIIASDVVLSEGVQIMAGAVVQTGCRIGKNVIINTRAVLDHDCQIENHVHVAPGVVLSGGVKVGENALIGAGATVIQEIRIGQYSVVGAGAVVIRDVMEGVTVIGVPANGIKS